VELSEFLRIEIAPSAATTVMKKGKRLGGRVISLSAAANNVKKPAEKRASTILVVEDEVLIRLMMADELRVAGFEVIEAASADEALAVLNAAVQVDLLITDIRMPGSIDGERFAIMAHSTWPHLKIVIVSTHSPGFAASSVMDAFIGKPFDPVRLVERIRSLLKDEVA
jgi:CheY-like chemotaxis protein